MSWTVFKSSLQLRRTALLWYSIGITAYGWMIVAFYPLMEENLDYMEAVEAMFSEELLAVFGGAGLDFATIGGFLGVEYLSLMWVFIIGAAVITFAASALGGSVDDGTMELTLAQPVSRLQVVLSRYAALAVYAALLNFVTAATLYLPGLLHDVDIPLDAAALLAAIGWVMSMAIGGFAYAVSAFSSGSGRAVAASLGAIAAMWLTDILGNISEKFDWLTDVSMFHYWKPNEVFDSLHVASESWAVFGVAAVVFFAVAVIGFMRRDVV